MTDAPEQQLAGGQPLPEPQPSEAPVAEQKPALALSESPAAPEAKLAPAAPEPHRLRIPTKSQLRAQAKEIEHEALALVWRFIATESRDAPTDADITIEHLGEALDDLGWGWEQLQEWIARVKEARLALKPFDRGAAKIKMTNATTKIRTAQERAAELRKKADQLVADANNFYGAALQTQAEAQRAEGDAAVVYQEAMVAGCPGDIDLQLQCNRRIVRVLRPSIEMGRNVDPGEILEYAGPDRPWLEDYDGPVAVGGVDPLPVPSVNEANEAIADKVAAEAAQFESGGLPGKQLLKGNTIQVTGRPTTIEDFPNPVPTLAGPADDVRAPQPGEPGYDEAHNPLPTRAAVTSRPSDGQLPAPEPEPFDPWEDE